MIVKTGANYQEEGGYIEFSADNPNGVTIVNDKAVPTILYETAKQIIGVVPAKLKKTPESSGAIQVWNYLIRTSREGIIYRDSQSDELTTTETIFTIPLGFGAPINTPSGTKPVLMDGSKDVQIISRYSFYYLYITGADPVAVLSYTEA